MLDIELASCRRLARDSLGERGGQQPLHTGPQHHRQQRDTQHYRNSGCLQPHDTPSHHLPTMSFYHKHSHHHRGIFVVAALALAGICSLFPVMCFKGSSSKEKAKAKLAQAELEAQQKADEKWLRQNAPRPRHRSHSPPRVAHTPHRRHHRRHHSSETDDRHSRIPHRADRDPSPAHHHRRRSGSRQPANDRRLDRERRHRHHGHPPPRRYHHSS